MTHRPISPTLRTALPEERDLLIFLEQRCNVDEQGHLLGRQEIGAVSSLTSTLSHTIFARRGELNSQTISLAESNGHYTVEWPKHARDATLLAKAGFAAWRQVGRHRATLVYAPGIVGLLGTIASTMRRRPLIVIVVGDPSEALSRFVLPGRIGTVIRTLMVAATKYTVAQASIVRYVTERTLQEKYPAGKKAAQYAATDAKIEPILLLPPTTRSERTPPYRLLTVATLEQPYKGVSELIQAVSILNSQGHEVELNIAGEGRLRESLQELAASQPFKSTNFLGHLGKSELLTAYAESDVFVLASWTEGLPRAMVEAMGLGMPVVGTAVGGIPELVDDRYLCKPRDVSGLVGTLGNLMEQRDSWAMIGQENFDRVRLLCDAGRVEDRAFASAVASLIHA